MNPMSQWTTISKKHKELGIIIKNVVLLLFYMVHFPVYIFKSSLPGLTVHHFMFSIEVQATDVLRFRMWRVGFQICLCLFSQTIMKSCLLFQVHVWIRAAKSTGLYKNERTVVSLQQLTGNLPPQRQTDIQILRTGGRPSSSTEDTLISFL